MSFLRYDYAFSRVIFPSQTRSLYELYEKAMRKHRCRAPATLFPFHSLLPHDTIKISGRETEAIKIKQVTEAELTKELQEQYMKSLPEGMTSDEVRDMSDDDLLDMDYFLHEFDDLDDDDFGEKGFYVF